jgi:hypothetical protein
MIGQLETNLDRVTNAIKLGAKAMASAIIRDSIEVCWQPVVYRAAPGARRLTAVEDARPNRLRRAPLRITAGRAIVA